MDVTGYRVELPKTKQPWELPKRCANCGGEANSLAFARHRFVWKGRRLVQIPYCPSCHRAVFQEVKSETLAVLGCCALGAVLAAAICYVPSLPREVSIAVPTLITAMASWFIIHRFPFKLPLAPRTSTSDAVWITADSKGLVFTNLGWAKDFAESHRLPAPTPYTLHRFTEPIGAAGFAAIASAATAFYMFSYTHPVVYIDGGDLPPVRVWLDGKRTNLMAGTERVWVDRGVHTLGWSPSGATSATSTIQVDVRQRNNLYSPSVRACYWRDVSVYGSRYDAKAGRGVHVPGAPPEGPIELGEFYSFDQVDSWFEPNPSEVDSRGRKYRVALRRNVPCTELLTQGCSQEIATWFVRCQVEAEDSAGVDQCLRQARRRCSGADR